MSVCVCVCKSGWALDLDGCCCPSASAERQQTYPETKSGSDKTQTLLKAGDVVPLLTKPGDNCGAAARSLRAEREKGEKEKAIIFL